MITIFFRVTLVSIAITLSALVVYQGMANYYADERGRDSSVEDLKKAVEWNSNHSFALGALGKHYLSEKDFDKAEEYLFRSLANNPTYGLATSSIIETSEQKKDDALAKEAINYTRQLWPAHITASNNIVKYWLRKNRVDKILPEWNVILSQDPSFASSFFPILFQLTQDPVFLALFKPYAKKPSTWWKNFFTYLTRQEDNLGSLEWLYQTRLESKQPLSNTERKSYVERLVKEKKWMSAYFGWLSGMQNEYYKFLQFKLYDGGFESDLNNTGFDWYFSSNKIVDIRPEITRGMNGKAALHIAFNKRERIDFRHVSQRLLLSPGDYTLKMRSRTDRLRTNKGLKWRLRCLGNQEKILGESRSLLGSSAWKNEEFNLSVPQNDDCQVQLLRLEATSPYAHNHVFIGDIWFDDIQIEKKQNIKNKNTTIIDTSKKNDT